jgi:WD40 repeat protein
LTTRGALLRDKPIAADTQSHSPASHIWHLLNPKDDPLVHLRIESPTMLIFSPDITDSQLSTDPKLYHRSRFSIRTLEGLVWVLKIVLIPILATVGVLYPLLLYLLKDAQLLEAQNNHAERDEPELPTFDPPVDDQISFTTLPRAFSTDVEMIAASQGGQIVATIGMHDEFVIWRMGPDNRMHVNIDVTDMLLGRAGSSASKFCMTTLGLDDNGLFCAVGSRTGVIAIWGIDNEHVKLLHQLSLEGSSSVTDLCFITSSSMRSQVPNLTTSLLATYENGSVVNWTIGRSIEPIRIHPSRPTLSSKSAIVLVPTRKTRLVAFFFNDGTLELRNVPPNADSTLDFCVPAGNPADPVSLVHACDLEINGIRHTIVGAATKAGVISVWDGETSECITIIDDVYGQVNNLRLSATKARSCSFCGELRPDAFTISFSVGHIILVYRAYVFIGAVRKCSCPNNQPQQVSFKSAGVLKKKRTRHGSTPTSGTASPLHSRSRHHSLSNGNTSFVAASFPISGHGVHSRRTTEKDMLRRAIESMVLPTPTSENEELEKAPTGFGALLGAPTSTSMASRSPLWQNVVVVRAADATFERGKWDLVNDKIVGLRRRPRVLQEKSSTAAWKVQLGPETSSGLSAASLERWELWVLDPWVSKIQASSLAALQRDQSTSQNLSDQICGNRGSRLRSDSSHNSIPRLPFTRVTPFVCVPPYCFAGFGNTVGLFELTACSTLGRKT